MLLWIEIKRCHGILIAPLVAALALWMIRQNDLRDGVVLWSDVSREVYDITWMMSAFGAAFAAWVVGRSQRRRIDTQEDTSAIPVGRVSLIAIVAASIWMFASYLVVFTYMAIPAIRFATWGDPEWPVLALGALAIVVPVMVGGLVGQFGRSILVPPVVLVAVLALNVFASDSGRKYQEATLIPPAFKPTFDNPHVDIRALPRRVRPGGGCDPASHPAEIRAANCPRHGCVDGRLLFGRPGAVQ
jgi:hypothetical protein